MNGVIKSWALSSNCSSARACQCYRKVGAVASGHKTSEILSVRDCDYLKVLELNNFITIETISTNSLGIRKLFVYNKKSLEAVLKRKVVKRILVDLGYPNSDDYKVLVAHLVEKLKQSDEFPHEIGFFLGYPIKDVIGYMGLKSLPHTKTLSWQVYGSPVLSDEIFCKFCEGQNQINRLLEIASKENFYDTDFDRDFA